MITQSSPRQWGKQEEHDDAVGIQVGVPEEQRQIIKAQKKQIVQMLLNGDVYGLPGSSGTKLSNFLEWAKNQHPLCSMFFAHELHPFTRCERFCVMMCYLCWAILITAIFEANNHKAEQVCRPGCENAFSVRVAQKAEEICGPGSGENENKVSLEEYESACDNVLEWYILSLIIAACTVPYSTILKILATCGCAQNLPGCCKRFFECIGSFVLAMFGCLSIIWLAMAIIISLNLDGGLFLVTYVVSVVESWLYWPFIAGAVFWWKYDKAKRKFEEQNPGQVAMAWPVDLKNHSYWWGERGSEGHSHEVPPRESPRQPQRSAAVSNPPSPYVDHQHVDVMQVPISTAEPFQAYSSDLSPSGSSIPRGFPSGWEAVSLPDGRVAYLDHNQKKTQWSPPHLTSPHERQPLSPSNMEHVASTAGNHPFSPRESSG